MDDQYLFNTHMEDGEPYLSIWLHNVPLPSSHVEVTLHMDASGLHGALDHDRWVLLDLIAERINSLRDAHRQGR